MADIIVAKYLRHRGFKQAESALKNEAKISSNVSVDDYSPSDLLQLISEPEDPERVISSYNNLYSWVETSIQNYKTDLNKILFPVFCHLYLDMVEHHQGELGKK
jgi:transcription initiation factor TFIID subunit 5